jgi:hypothetical protein
MSRRSEPEPRANPTFVTECNADRNGAHVMFDTVAKKWFETESQTALDGARICSRVEGAGIIAPWNSPVALVVRSLAACDGPHLGRDAPSPDRPGKRADRTAHLRNGTAARGRG